MPMGPAAPERENSVMPLEVPFVACAGTIWPILLLPAVMPSVNHSAPSGPAAIPRRRALAVITGNSVTPVEVPATAFVGSIRPTLLGTNSRNHSAPSGPAAMLWGSPLGVRNSVMVLVVGSIRPILPPLLVSVNHRAPSGPAAMPTGKLLLVVIGNSVTVWVVGSIRPILLAISSTNHSAPSGPEAMPRGLELAVRMGNSAMTWVVGSIRPMLLPDCSVNQSAPSGPAVIASAKLFPVGMGNSVMPLEVPFVASAGSIRPMELVPLSVNQSAPSAPRAMLLGRLLPEGSGKEVTTGVVVASAGSLQAPANASPVPINMA